MDPSAGQQPPALGGAGAQQEVNQPAGPWQGHMDSHGAPWTPGQQPAALMDFFLADDTCPSALFTDLLDPATLAAMAGSSGVDPVPPPAPGVAEDTRRKLMEQQDSDNSDAEEGSAGGGSKSGVKRSRSEANQAAKNKATREKARREKINDRFQELAQLIDPGKEPKTDKPSILQDTIKCVQQMRMENHQLRQLNKFLEERMGQLERERGQTLYQQSLMMQHGGGMMGMPGMPSSSGAMPAFPPGPHPHPHMAAAAAAAAVANSHQTPGASTSAAPFPPAMRMPPHAHASHPHSRPSTSSAPAASTGASGHPHYSAAHAAAVAAQAAAQAASGSEQQQPVRQGSRPPSRTQQHPDTSSRPQPHPSEQQPHAQHSGSDAGEQIGAGPLPSASFPPPAAKLGQLGAQATSLPMGSGAPWFPGAAGDASGLNYGDLYGGNWVKPEMLDSMQDSLLRPPAA